MKVIADHSRAAAFLIGDGILPSNEGRGYVLRRIMRRAIRFGRNIGLHKPFLFQTAEVVFDIMKQPYPELQDAAAFIVNVIKNEEIRFLETLDTGMKLLNETLAEIKDRGRNEVPGDVIFKLYDTYGFPVDIVQDVVRDEDMRLDMVGFNRAMDRQRARSRSVARFDRISEAYKNLSARGVKPEFVGYDSLTAESTILLIVVDGEEVAEALEGQQLEIVTNLRKSANKGYSTTSLIMGSRELYDYVHMRTGVQMRSCSYTNAAETIRRNAPFISINTAMGVDLLGNVWADFIDPRRYYSGVGGQPDFVRAVNDPQYGVPVIAIKSITDKGESKIIERHPPGISPTATAYDPVVIVTEYGMADLRGLTFGNKALAIASIAHPDFRDKLLRAIYEDPLFTKPVGYTLDKMPFGVKMYSGGR